MTQLLGMRIFISSRNLRVLVYRVEEKQETIRNYPVVINPSYP